MMYGRQREGRTKARRRETRKGGRERTMKRAFGMPRGFFSLSWMISGGVFEVDIVQFGGGQVQMGRWPDLISELSCQ